MQKLKEIKSNLKLIVDKCTDYFSKTILTKNIAFKFVPAYVLLMQKYYKFLYLHDVNEFLYTKQETPQLTQLIDILADINKCIEVINSAGTELDADFNFSKINTALLDNKKGGYETEVFYNEVISKMEQWTLDTPKNKILKHLEIWTGEKSEKAILKTIVLLKHNSNLLFDKVLSVNNLNEHTNKIISNTCKEVFLDLLAYYIKHRDLYLPKHGVNEIRKISDTKNEFKITFKDKYLELDIKYKNCDFEYFVPGCKKIINAITKIDHAATFKLFELFKDTNQVNKDKSDIIGFRKQLKLEIIEILDIIGEDLKCESTNANVAINVKDFNSNSENFVKVIVPLVQSIIKAEKLVKSEIHTIKENLKLQIINLNTLKNKLFILIGPSTKPCIKQFTIAALQKVKKMNSAQIKDFIKNNL